MGQSNERAFFVVLVVLFTLGLFFAWHLVEDIKFDQNILSGTSAQADVIIHKIKKLESRISVVEAKAGMGSQKAKPASAQSPKKPQAK